MTRRPAGIPAARPMIRGRFEDLWFCVLEAFDVGDAATVETTKTVEATPFGAVVVAIACVRVEEPPDDGDEPECWELEEDPVVAAAAPTVTVGN